MNADGIEIDIERFIYKIQIRLGILDLADWHKFDISSSKEDILIRVNKKTLSGFACRSA